MPGVARRDDVAAGRDPPHPPRQPEDVVARPDDEPGSHVRDAPGQGGLRGALARGLQGAVVVALGPQRARLVDRLGRPLAVHAGRGDEDEVRARPGEQRRGGSDVPGLEARRVDGGVPGAPAQLAEVAAPVAPDVRGAIRGRRAVQTAREDRHLVTAPERRLDHRPPEEDRAAEDQDAHDAQPSSCGYPRRPLTLRDADSELALRMRAA